jgi:hypothetical protein
MGKYQYRSLLSLLCPDVISASFPTRFEVSEEDLEKWSTVEEVSPLTRCALVSSPGFPHSLPAFHSLFCHACGSGGIRVPQIGLSSGFSKSPDSHSRVLENSHPSQTRYPCAFHPDSHFSYDTYGDYCFCI